MEKTILSVIFMIYGIRVGSDERAIAMRAVTRTAAKTAFFVGALVSGMGLAAAADLPVKAMSVAYYDWTGFYVGGHVGYGWSNTTTTLDGFPISAWAPFGSEPGIPASYDRNLRGFIGGGQVGYNYQTGRVVLGVETDLSYTNIHNDLTRSGLDQAASFFVDNESQKLKWLATVRGRLGFAAMDRLLIFATGGLAVGKIDVSSSFSYPGAIAYSGTATTTKTGWTLGGGAEYALLNNWSVKFEYLYVDLGTVSVIGNPSPPNPPVYTQAVVETKSHIARLGINYKFGASATR